MSGSRHFAGFGFGPIQSGLMLLEAQASGNFSRFTIAEVDHGLVGEVRANSGRVTVNVARADGVEHRLLEGIEILNPAVPADREALVEAVRAADELATALPSVDFYARGGAASVAAVLADGLDGSKQRLLYASENHNHAASLLIRAVSAARGGAESVGLQAVDTVIGKMSGVIRDPAVAARLGLAAMTPGGARAVLVEAFNRILISRVSLPGFARGIGVFEEKDDLLPFEEAKLYGHNAIHAVLGYLARGRGLKVMSEIARHRDLLELGRRAFIEESGAALIRRHGGSGEALFTPGGYAGYADDLLRRMVNPCLNDEIERVCRDPRRKLGYDDRLAGTIRLAVQYGLETPVMASGAAAALEQARVGGEIAVPAGARDEAARQALAALWGPARPGDGEVREECLRRIARAYAGMGK